MSRVWQDGASKGLAHKPTALSCCVTPVSPCKIWWNPWKETLAWTSGKKGVKSVEENCQPVQPVYTCAGGGPSKTDAKSHWQRNSPRERSNRNVGNISSCNICNRKTLWKKLPQLISKIKKFNEIYCFTAVLQMSPRQKWRDRLWLKHASTEG